MATTTSTTKTGMAGGPPAQLATPIEYATGYALATPRSSFAATEERMLENQIIHFTLDFTENSNSERKKNGERRYRRLQVFLIVDCSRLLVSKGSPLD